MTSVIAQTTIKIIDQEGHAVQNAVAELTMSDVLTSVTDADKVYIMDQVNKAFKPEVLIVPQASLVRFPNSDDIRHHVYSFSPAKPFELKLYAGKPKNPIRFEQQGVIVLGCNIHDAMVGYIYVTDKPDVVKSDDKGMIHLDISAEQLTSLNLWHPQAKSGVESRKLFTQKEFKVEGEIITLTIELNSPEPRDSFEDQFYYVQ